MTNPMGSGSLDVTGASGEHAIRGVASGTGAAGMYGESGDSSGYGGYFKGNAHVTGDMTVEGTLTWDKSYDREVCIIKKNDVDINREMVARGYAWAYREHLKGPYASIDAEREAREKKRGL